MIDIHKPNAGFTLVELLIVVAIVSILAAIAYPSYVDSVRKGRRNDGMAAVMDAAQRLEVFRSNNASYTTNLASLGIDDTSDDGYYNNMQIIAGACGSIINCYTITIDASTQGDQNQDSVTSYRQGSNGVKERLEHGSWVSGWR
ncbi:MAG: type IV pilin protein [Candidatus Thiodiazotropha sp.]